jgi:Ankyrin repeats (many copies)
MDTWKPDLQSRVVDFLQGQIKGSSDSSSGRYAFIIARMYSSGFGTTLSCPPDAAEGLKWLEKSATLGYEPAFLVGNRIFKANGRTPPEIFNSPPGKSIQVEYSGSELHESLYYISLLKAYLRSISIGTVLSTIVTTSGEPLNFNDLKSVQNWIVNNRADALDFSLIVNPQRSSQASLIHLAALVGNISVVRMIVETGVNVDIVDTRGQTPLLVACMMGFSDLALFLLSEGADPTIADEIWATPLHWIFAFDDSCMLRVASSLIERGAECCLIQSTWNYYPIEALCLILTGTPLQWAISVHSRQAVKLLLSIGASPLKMIEDTKGLGRTWTPMEFACGRYSSALHGSRVS